MESLTNNFVDTLINSTLTCATELNDYCQLALKQDPSEEEADRLKAIYEKAENDPLLNFFLITLDRVLAERLGLLNEETLKHHGNQQAWLREHLEESLFDQNYRSEIQQLLKEQGFYNGPIDGILGQRFFKAFKQFQKSWQEGLQRQGFYKGKIDGRSGAKSVAAVMQFQRHCNIKKDGVVGKETLKKLQPMKPT